MEKVTAPNVLRNIPCRRCFCAVHRHARVTIRTSGLLACTAHRHIASIGQRRLQVKAPTLRQADLRVRAVNEPGMHKTAGNSGSSWVPSGVLLAAGGAMPGLLLASRWQEVRMSECSKHTAVGSLNIDDMGA